LICPECGSYQPEDVKFCGLCGVPLTPEGQASHFLTAPPEDTAIELPRRRRPMIFLWAAVGILALLALLGGMGLLLYHVTRDQRTPPRIDIETPPDVLEYSTPDGSVRFSYPRLWDLTEVKTDWGQLKLLLQLTSSKQLTITSEQLDPDLLLGNLDEMRDYVVDLIYRDVAGSRSTPSDPPPSSQKIEEDLLSVNLNGRQAYSYRAETTVGGVRTTILYYFVVSSDLLYQLRCTAPSDLWEEAISDFMVVIGTFQVQ